MNTWSLSWNGLRTVVELEIKQRIRSNRWFWALLVWFVAIGAVTGLVIFSVSWIRDQSGSSTGLNPGALAFGLITYFVLGMGLMIAPAFTATSLNGDRNAGTLATLQATRLSAVEIAAGKLMAAWLTSLVFLVVVIPFIVWSTVLGRISFLQVLVTFVVVFIEVAVVCAIGLGWSALVSRPAGSALLTYVSVVTLTVLTVVVTALSVSLTYRTESVRVWGLPPSVEAEYNQKVEDYWNANKDKTDTSGTEPLPPVDKCTWYETREGQTHTERVWWMVVANPFVIVADAAPLPPGSAQNLSEYKYLSSDPLAMLRWAVRKLSQAPATERDDCASLYGSLPGYVVSSDTDGTVTVTTTGGTPVSTSPIKTRAVNVENPVWPWGLGANLLLGAGFFLIAVRRLRVPYGKLPKGLRVA